MKRPPEALSNPRNYLLDLSRTNEFIDARRQGEPVPIAMAAAAFKGVESMREAQSGRLDTNGNALNLISTIPNFISGQYELDLIYAKEERSRITVPREVKIPHLEKVITFNHALREMIDGNPQLKPAEVCDFVIKTAMGVYPTDQIDFAYLGQQVSQRISSMQQEIATEQALWCIEEAEDIENGGLMDELAGADLIFTYRNQTVRIDVKSSSSGEQKAWQQWDNGDPFPFWTGITCNDLGDRFRANDKQLEIITRRIKELLEANLQHDRNYAIV